jgi:hypothetical protein
VDAATDDLDRVVREKNPVDGVARDEGPDSDDDASTFQAGFDGHERLPVGCESNDCAREFVDEEIASDEILAGVSALDR